MSSLNPFKAVGKVFKKVTKEIGRAVDTVVDVVKDVADSDIFKAIVVVAAIYFTAGTASAYFAGPTAGSLGASASLTAGNMWSGTVAFFGGEAAAAGATESVAALDGMAAAAPSVAAGEVTAVQVATDATWGVNAVAGTEAAATAGTAATGTSGLLGAGEVAGAAGSSVSTAVGTTAAQGAISAGTMGALDTAAVGLDAAAASSGGMMGWLADNPMATMMLGQGVMGAAQGYSADKSAERMQDAENERLQNRGLGGFDYKGVRQGSPRGVVASQQTTEQVVAEPDAAKVTPVQQQEVTPQTVQRPVPKDQLPKLLENGQLA